MRERARKSGRPQAPFGPSVDSLCHPWFTTTNLSYRFPIFETSATALCGTTGIYIWLHVYNPFWCLGMFDHFGVQILNLQPHPRWRCGWMNPDLPAVCERPERMGIPRPPEACWNTTAPWQNMSRCVSSWWISWHLLGSYGIDGLLLQTK